MERLIYKYPLMGEWGHQNKGLLFQAGSLSSGAKPL